MFVEAKIRQSRQKSWI